MKKLCLLTILLISVIPMYSQKANYAISPSSPKPDTIIYYKVDSESMSIKGGTTVYKVNDKIVSQQQWSKMTIGNAQMKTCTPCIVKTYDDKDNLLSIGMQYKWCKSGTYTEYYPDGKVKVTGQYKTNALGTSGKPTSATYCGVKEGTWTYYTESGEIAKTELFKNGQPVK